MSNEAIQAIKANIDKRSLSKDNHYHWRAEKFARDFTTEVILPASAFFKKAIADGDIDHDNDLNFFEQWLIKKYRVLKLVALDGFESPMCRDNYYEIYEIEATFLTEDQNTITLEAKVSRSTYGDGSEVKSWSLKLDGKDISSFVFESEKEDEICSFIYNNYSNYGDFDNTLKPLSEDDMALISKVLGIK